MNPLVLALSVASPWIIGPAVTIWRVRRSRDLGAVSSEPVVDAPLVTVIVPARDERRNIERCLRAALGGNHASLDVVVVDDRSSDGTGDLARAIAGADSRLRVIENAELPEGWFGKPWACASGARGRPSRLHARRQHKNKKQNMFNL